MEQEYKGIPLRSSICSFLECGVSAHFLLVLNCQYMLFVVFQETWEKVEPYLVINFLFINLHFLEEALAEASSNI